MMSQADIERFVDDLKSNAELLEGLKAQAAGLASVVDFARSKGYDITVDEAKAYIREQARQDLTDDQLDAVAGGKHHGGGSAATKVAAYAVEAAMETSTAVQAVEAVTTTVEAADAATTVEVVAEVAIVAT